MTPINSILIAVLNSDRTITELSLSEWDLLIRQARKSMLLAKLFYFINSNSHTDSVPASALRFLQSAQVHSTKQYNDLCWEIKHLEEVARQLQFPLVLLKGSAYAIAKLPAAQGRIFADIDLMVSKSQINETEKYLMMNGWVPSHSDPYDELYYRKWMHEIPPVHHVHRGSTLDLHHNILPMTAKNSPDANLLLQQSQALENYDFIHVLSATDMIIHSATHLFYDGELEHGLRDLVDLDALLRQHLNNEHFTEKLRARAQQLNLQRPLFYALRYTSLLLQTPFTVETRHQPQSAAPNKFMLKIMDSLFLRALMPDHPSCSDRWTEIARYLLYIRAHYLRMPVYLLIPHLLRKSILRLSGKSSLK